MRPGDDIVSSLSSRVALLKTLDEGPKPRAAEASTGRIANCGGLMEPIGIKFAGVDESARLLDVPAITPVDGFQSGKTRTHRVFTGVLVPQSETVYGYEGHATKLLNSESRVHPYGRRGTVK
jgi:hypothetical protein